VTTPGARSNRCSAAAMLKDSSPASTIRLNQHLGRRRSIAERSTGRLGHDCTQVAFDQVLRYLGEDTMREPSDGHGPSTRSTAKEQ
jgi:hypothetical protein